MSELGMVLFLFPFYFFSYAYYKYFYLLWTHNFICIDES